jgi:hypothetical protein
MSCGDGGTRHEVWPTSLRRDNTALDEQATTCADESGLTRSTADIAEPRQHRARRASDDLRGRVGLTRSTADLAQP